MPQASPIFIARTPRQELRRLTQLAMPIAGAQLATMLMGFVDTVMLGHYSTDAMAAAVLANSLVFGTMMFANGILFGLDPLITQAHGAGDGRAVALALQRGMVLALLLSVPVGVSWLFTGEFMLALGQEPRLVPLAQGYMDAVLPSIPFFLWLSVLRQYLQGREIVRPALYVTLAANVFNALFNWVLIFGHLGFPELGIRGAGIATTSVRVVSLLLLVGLVVWARLHRGAWQGWSRQALDLRALARITAIGFPVAIQTSTEMWAFNLATFLAGSLGAIEAAAHGIVMNLASISFMLALGVAVATTTRVGNLLGAGRPADAQRASWIGIAMGSGVMTLSAVSFVVFRQGLPMLYTLDAEVVALAALVLPVAAAFQVFDGAQVVGCGVLRGMGRTRPAAFFNFVGYWLLGLPIGWWIGVREGWLGGLWWGLVLGLAVVATGIVLWVRVRGPATMTSGDRVSA
ncbi:MAG: MATE family efflux transporter [Myxococcota bacterium]